MTPGRQCHLKAWSLSTTSCGSGVHPDSGAKCEPAVEESGEKTCSPSVGRGGWVEGTAARGGTDCQGAQ